jgi:hypothetical protein
MPFTDEEIQSLLAVKGIGKTILQRLQQMGLMILPLWRLRI